MFASVNIPINLGLNQFNQQLNQVKRQLSSLGSAVGSVGNQTAFLNASAYVGLQSTVDALGQVSGALVGIGTQSVKTFVEFSKTVNSFRVFGSATTEQASAFADEARRLGSTTTKTAQEVADAGVELSKLGFSASKTKEELAGLVALSEATGATTETAAKIVGAGSAVFQRSAQDLADVTSGLANLTAANPQDFLQAISKAGGVAKANSQSLETLAAAFGLLRNAGFQAETAGTALKTVFNRISAPASGVAKKSLEELGVKIRDNSGQVRNFIELIPEFRDAFAQIAATQGKAKEADLARNIFGDRGGPALLALLSQTQGEIDRVYSGIVKSSGSAASSAKKLTEGIAGQLAIFRSAIEGVQLSIGETFAPIVQGLAAAGTAIANGFLALPKPLQQVSVLFVSLVAAVGGLIAAYATFQLLQIKQTISLIANTSALIANEIAAKATGLAQLLLGNYFGIAGTQALTATTKIQILGTALGKLLLIGGLVAGAVYTLSELFRESEGAKFAQSVENSNIAFVKANESLFTYNDRLKIFSGSIKGQFVSASMEVQKLSEKISESLRASTQGFSDLGTEIKNVGLTEAIRQQLAGGDLINLLPPLQALIPVINAIGGEVKSASDINSDYGNSWQIITGAQLGNQKAALAMEQQQMIVNMSLDEGYKILGKYAVGTRLSATESEEFKKSLENQISILEENKKILLQQKPPTKALQELQQTEIFLIDKQINLARGRIKGLTEEGNTIKNIVVPSYDELIGKFQELERVGKLNATNRQFKIEEQVVTGNLTKQQAEEKQLLANRIKINEELRNTQNLRKDLEVSAVGADAEQGKKIQEELNKSIQQEADLRLEAVQNQAKILENNQQNEIEKARVGILRTQSFEKLRQLKLEQDIAAGKIKGNDIEKERGRIQLESLQAQLRENQAAQKRLSGQPGEIIGSDQQKLKDEAIDLQSQIAQAQIQEQERVTQVRTEQEQKIRDEQEKTKEAAIKSIDERFRAEQAKTEKLTNQSEIKTTQNDFRSSELQAQQQLTEALSGLDKQRLDFQLELANRSQNVTQSEQAKLAIYQQQKEQLALQQQQQQQSIALSREQQQLELERKKLTADLAILEAQANLEKAKSSGASASEIASLESAIAIRQSQRDLIDQEAQSIEKVNSIEDQRVGIENKVKAEQLEQQRVLELQDIAVQRITTSLESQKSVIDGQSARLDLTTKSLERQSQVLSAQQQLSEANANLEKQRLDYQLSLANLTGDFNRIEQTKAGIYLQQREEILRQTEAQQVSVALSKQQQEIELQRQQLQAQSALLEAQANVEKAKAQGVSGQQLAILQQSVGIQQAQLDAIAQQRATSEQVSAIEAQRATIENQIKLEQLDQQRQLELIEAKAQEIVNAFEKQREQLDLSSQSLDLNTSRLERQSNLLAAQSGVSDAINERDAQRLNYQLEIARTVGDATQEERLKQAIYQQQVQALIQKQAVDRESLKISSEQKAIDLERQKIQAEIALLEAQANIEEAKVKGVSEDRLASLQKIADLRAKALGSVDADMSNQARINALENKRLSVQQQTALEQLQQSKNLEDLRKQQEALNKAKEDAANKLKGDGTTTPDGKTPPTPPAPIPSVTPDVYLSEADLKRKPVSGMTSMDYPKPPGLTDFLAEFGLGKTAADVAAEQQQAIQTATINAQSVYLNGQILGQPQQPKSDAGKISQPTTTDPEARLKAANQAIDDYVANFNAEAEQERLRSGLTAEQATAGGFQQAKLAREEAARIRADLASGRLKTTQGNFTPEQMVTPLQKLQQELNAAQKAVDQKKQSEKKDPAKLYDLVAGIYGYLKQNGGGNSVDNLVIVSSDPTGDAREVLNQLTRSKRNC